MLDVLAEIVEAVVDAFDGVDMDAGDAGGDGDSSYGSGGCWCGYNPNTCGKGHFCDYEY